MKVLLRNLLAGFLIFIFLITCDSETTPIIPTNVSEKDITIFYTNDEHGWIEESQSHSGASGMYAEWQIDGLGTTDKFLVLSGGDMWTGPAISTLFKGEPTQQVMNNMEYSAAAIGNHEFDFTVATLNKRLNESSFPYLSSNIKEKSSGKTPSFATPYIIKTINEVDIAIIGLTTISTPFTAFTKNVEDYEFIDYNTALNEISKEVSSKNPEIIVVLGHINPFEMQSLIPTLKNLEVDVVLGGHSHEQFKSKVEDIILIVAGSSLHKFGKINLTYNENTDKVTASNFQIIDNNSTARSDKIDNIVYEWKEELNNKLSEKIGYTSYPISKNSFEMFNMVCDSWLFKYDKADISITNAGSIRQSIPPGDITTATIFSLLPFDNELFILELKGSEVLQCISQHIYGGIKKTNSGYELNNGNLLHNDSTYSILTTDYLYYLPNSKFRQFDDTPIMTSDNFRQPLVEWLRSINTSISDPLGNYLDYTNRY